MSKFFYSYGHDEGWTDDLGIIADRNQWVKEELPGWYCCWPDLPAPISDLGIWCTDNLSGYWKVDEYGRLYLSSDVDLSWFQLKWS